MLTHRCASRAAPNKIITPEACPRSSVWPPHCQQQGQRRPPLLPRPWRRPAETAGPASSRRQQHAHQRLMLGTHKVECRAALPSQAALQMQAAEAECIASCYDITGRCAEVRQQPQHRKQAVGEAGSVRRQKTFQTVHWMREQSSSSQAQHSPTQARRNAATVPVLSPAEPQSSPAPGSSPMQIMDMLLTIIHAVSVPPLLLHGTNDLA